jgi:hypothetical protein
MTFGQFASPNWETSDQFIPPIGTRTGVPAVQGMNTLQFNLFVTAGTPPPTAGPSRSSATAGWSRCRWPRACRRC